MTRTILVLAVATAFVIGTITTGTLAYASGDKNGKPFEQIWEAIHNLETAGSSGSEMPISLGSDSMFRSVVDCRFTPGSLSTVTGFPVLLSDGTVMVPSPTGGFIALNPDFGSLPTGVWHDIEGVYDSRSNPAGCNFSSERASDRESIRACAVADTGDVYCINGQIGAGLPTIDTWAFQGDTIP